MERQFFLFSCIAKEFEFLGELLPFFTRATYTNTRTYLHALNIYVNKYLKTSC